MNKITRWEKIKFPNISENFLISPEGFVRFKDIDETLYMSADYHSSNGYDYILLMNTKQKLQLFPIDELIANTYIPIPKQLMNKRIIPKHLNGNTRDNSIINLEWIEDVEIWKPISDQEIISEGYMISNHGHVLAPSNNAHKEAQCISTIRNGYSAITLRTNHNNDRRSYFIHRLVCSHFKDLPYYQYPMDINHIDGDKSNNHWKNLEIVTRAQNNKHARLTGLCMNAINLFNENTIRNLLIKHEGSIINTLNDPDCPEGLTESILSIFKRHLIEDEHLVFKVRLQIKITPEIYQMIKKLIIEHDGNLNEVLKIISQEYPDINIDNLKSIKRKMLLSENIQLKNWKRNRKISENERTELLEILKNNDLSPAKAFENIKNDINFKNITIYDLKYLKRKYFKS